MVSLWIIQVFKPFENKTYSILQYKLTYILINLITFSFIIYRVNSMGLLPFNVSDWVSSMNHVKYHNNLLNSLLNSNS